MIKSYKDLEVYKKAYKLAMEIFYLTKRFPKDEIYSLTSQIIDSSRSVPANIAEGWAKRKYENIFKKQLVDALGSAEETQVWLDFALDCRYILKEEHSNFISEYNEVGKMLNGLIENWKTYVK
ncbi:MAG: four helix bundle protein [candidate division WOR-3 bacterium]